MAGQNLISAAKQGDTRAIAALINQSLRSQGIVAKVTVQENILKVLLESDPVPDKKAMVPFLRKGIDQMAILSISGLVIYGRKTGDRSPSWSESFSLRSTDQMPPIEQQLAEVEGVGEKKGQSLLIAGLKKPLRLIAWLWGGGLLGKVVIILAVIGMIGLIFPSENDQQIAAPTKTGSPCKIVGSKGALYLAACKVSASEAEVFARKTCGQQDCQVWFWEHAALAPKSLPMTDTQIKNTKYIYKAGQLQQQY